MSNVDKKTLQVMVEVLKKELEKKNEKINKIIRVIEGID